MRVVSLIVVSLALGGCANARPEADSIDSQIASGRIYEGLPFGDVVHAVEAEPTPSEVTETRLGGHTITSWRPMVQPGWRGGPAYTFFFRDGELTGWSRY